MSQQSPTQPEFNPLAHEHTKVLVSVCDGCDASPNNLKAETRRETIVLQIGSPTCQSLVHHASTK